MNSIKFLISTIFDFYIMIVILRIWLQASHADFYNPFSQFIVKATEPILGTLRQIIPSVGNIDLATILFAYTLCVFKLIALILITSNGFANLSTEFLFLGLVSLLKIAGGLLFWVLLICAILSWVSQGYSPVEYVFHQLTEPMLTPIRRIIPTIGGFDLSVLILFLVLQFANFLMGDLIGPVWYQL
ncbi:hypothetical protein CF67_09028 [Candidatus Photodesmus blepharus]|uniref:YggT family protein n=1 Tax=Candidatus Photodesmus blepharonis TaxID=1179155 RepID=A0A084CM28_9GAMM|nr:YggT family protein [Candidatus Photodesmus blepharus]KEY90857.1 hypothetical protein CF67_09028 [Candidatus Photodesmus blepharus]